MDINSMFSNPAWWISTVVVALLVGFASSVAATVVFNVGSRQIGGWRVARRERQQRIQQEMEKYADGIVSAAFASVLQIYDAEITVNLLFANQALIKATLSLLASYILSHSSNSNQIDPITAVIALIFTAFAGYCLAVYNESMRAVRRDRDMMLVIVKRQDERIRATTPTEPANPMSKAVGG